MKGSDGRVLAGSEQFPQPKSEGKDDPQWYDASFDGQALRVVFTRRSMYELGSAQVVSIAVGKTQRSRDAMRLKLWWPSVVYLLVALGLAGGLAILALTLELRPLMRLSRQLRRKDPLHLDLQVDASDLHSELRPVADTLNAFTEQLREHSDAQRRFIADAAHQLRTPLALQASQIEFARYTRSHRKDEDWAAAPRRHGRHVAGDAGQQPPACGRDEQAAFVGSGRAARRRLATRSGRPVGHGYQGDGAAFCAG